MADDRVSLLFDREQLVPYWIQKEAAPIAWDGLRVHGFLRIDSTNDEAIQMARSKAPEGTLVYAEEQTAGKGRLGRNWFSPATSGLYFSLILKPRQQRKYWPLLTQVASIALADTLKALPEHASVPHPLDVDLKWPNDILLSGRKTAGILLETTEVEGEDDALVLGIGINVHEGSYPESLKSEAVCLDEMAGTAIPRRQLLVQFLYHCQRVYQLFEKGKHSELIERWKNLSSMWNETPIWIKEGSESRAAVTCGLNEMGALLVRTEQGEVESIVAGDISIRTAQNLQDS